MRIIRRDLTKLFLLTFAIILYICPLYVTAQTIRVFSHTEGSNTPPRVLATRVYQNGTVVARIVRSNPTTPNCFDETLSLRVIRPDGSVDEKDIKLNIPQLNYCGTQFLDYQLIRGNHILVTYYNASDPNDMNTYEQWGLIVDFNGRELSKTPFGTQNQIIPNSKVVLNTDREKGFLILASVRDSSGVIYTDWKQYKIESDGNFTKLTEGLLNFDYFSNSTLTAVVSTVGESYSVLNAYTTNTNVGTNQNPLLQQGVIYAMNIGYNQSTVTSTIIYQTSTPNLAFTALSCDVAFAGVGQICTLTVVVAGSGTYYIEINYLSSGSVGYSNVVNRVISQSFLWKVNNLPFGGYLLTNFTGNSLYGFLFNEGDTNATQWDFAEPEPINSDGIFQILPNNTLLLFKEETGSSWQFHAIDLPRYANREDRGYSNINVESTEPAIGASIDSTNTVPTVSINFYKPVIPSNGQLSIYQVIDNQPHLRQLTPGIACSVVNDGKTVNADVLKSTFGVSNGEYFITIDNSFVKDGAYGENLLGIKDNIWKFTTMERKYSFSPSKAGLFRLTHAGTEYYDNLSKEGRHDFFSKFRSELSLAIPVNPARLTSIEKVQVDRSVNGKQYFISIRIEETKDEHDIDVATIVEYLDVMVNKKSQSPIGSGSVTGYLDETYGFIQLQGIWEKYRTELIVLFFLIMFLFAAYAVALRKSPATKNVEGTDGDTGENEPVRNTVVLHFGLIVFDLVMDILFVSISARDFPILYVLSVVFVTVPIAVNTTLAFYIITRENSKNKDFYKWFMDNAKISSIFTVISGANVEALYILKSHLLGIKLFKAPFSKDAEKYIYWGNILNIVIEDIPQVIIQICYYKFALSYGLVPLLTFVSSLLTLTIKLLAPLAKRLYKRLERYTSEKKVD